MLSCKWQDDEPFPFPLILPLILSDNNISPSLLITPSLLFTLRPTLSTLTVGVFCYQCFEHSSHQWICGYSRFSAGSRGEYRDKRWGDATHKNAYSDISLLYLISHVLFYSILFYSFTFYFSLFYPIKSFSIPFDCTLFHSFLLYSIIFCSTLS